MPPVHKARAPLESLDLLPVRFAEFIAHFEGGISDDQYPQWVQSNGAFLARKLVPRLWLKHANVNPHSFLKGYHAGLSLWFHYQDIDTLLTEKDQSMMSRAMRTSGIPDLAATGFADLIKIAQRTQSRYRKQTKQSLLAALDTDADRSPFLHGFGLGLDYDESLEELLKAIPRTAASGKIPLRLYLWLRWPEFNAMGSIHQAYERCKTAFSSIGEMAIVGDEDAFRRFCNRLGLSYKVKLHAK